jgi:hypothetical protein
VDNPVAEESGNALNPAQQEVLDELGTTDRPSFRPELRAELRQHLTEALAEHAAPFAVTPDPGEEPEPGSGKGLVLAKHGLGLLHGCESRFLAEEAAEFQWTVASARGTVAHKAIELLVVAKGPVVPLDVVERAITRLEADDRAISTFLQSLDEGERADLTSRANDFVATFIETFPPLQRQWKPVPEYSLRALLCNDAVTLRGKVDLSLGYVRNGHQAGKVFIDLKTGKPIYGHVEDLRFYALLETLKMGVPPRLLVSYYLDAGSPRTEAVTEDLLWSAARRVIDGAVKLAELTGPLRRAPTLTPGMNCRFCPILDRCDAGKAHLEASQQEDWQPF